jgi:hypothetical protein
MQIHLKTDSSFSFQEDAKVAQYFLQEHLYFASVHHSSALHQNRFAPLLKSILFFVLCTRRKVSEKTEHAEVQSARLQISSEMSLCQHCMSAFYAPRIRPAINHASRIGTCAQRNCSSTTLFLRRITVTLATNNTHTPDTVRVQRGESFASAPPFLSPSLIISCRMRRLQPHSIVYSILFFVLL